MIKNQSRVVILIYMDWFSVGDCLYEYECWRIYLVYGNIQPEFCRTISESRHKRGTVPGISRSAACFTRDYSCTDRNDTFSQNRFNCISGMDGHTLRRVFYMCGNESRSLRRVVLCGWIAATYGMLFVCIWYFVYDNLLLSKKTVEL